MFMVTKGFQAEGVGIALEGKTSAWQRTTMVWWDRAPMVSVKLARRLAREKVASRGGLSK
jgi:hypothetical protein